MNRKMNRIVLAAAVTAGGWSFVTAHADSTDQPTTAPSAENTMAPDANAIRNVLATVTNEALSTGKLVDLSNRLVQFDRDRVKPYFKENKADDYNAAVSKLNEAWKAKYGHDFKIKDGDQLLDNSFAMIQEAAEGDAAKLASGKLADDANGQMKAEVDKEVAKGADAMAGTDANRTGIDKPFSDAAKKNLNDPGRNIAVVKIAASDNLPEVSVNFIHQFPDSWKIDLPDTIDGQHLQNNLQRHLTAVNDMSAQWPSDENAAYRIVVHHVFMALEDTQMAK